VVVVVVVLANLLPFYSNTSDSYCSSIVLQPLHFTL